MTDKILANRIKESLDNVKPDENKKAELYNSILLKMEEKALVPENPIPFTEKLFSFFKSSIPYAAVCACLLLVFAIGFSGGFDKLFSIDTKTTEATVSFMADSVESRAYMAEACEEIPETALDSSAEDIFTEDNTVADNNVNDDSETERENTQILYSFQANGNVLTYSCNYEEYDPLLIWNELQKLNSDLEAIKLLSYNFDELNHIIILDFSEEIEDLINSSNTYNHIVYIGETYRSFYPDYRFSVKVNSELLMKDGKQVDFKSHIHTIISEN